jgi:hypothetical protein
LCHSCVNYFCSFYIRNGIGTQSHQITHSQYHCTTAHVKSSNHTLNLLCIAQFLSSSILYLSCLRWSSHSLGAAPHRKHRFLYFCVLIHCCRDVFTALLRNNERGAGHNNIALQLLSAFASAGMCLPSRCLAVNYFGIQTSCHITMLTRLLI